MNGAILRCLVVPVLGVQDTAHLVDFCLEDGRAVDGVGAGSGGGEGGLGLGVVLESEVEFAFVEVDFEEEVLVVGLAHLVDDALDDVKPLAELFLANSHAIPIRSGCTVPQA